MSNFTITEGSYKFDGSLKLANEKLNADQAPRVTFWGKRIVKFDGQDVSLNDLPKKVSTISYLLYGDMLYGDVGSNKQSSSLTLEDRVNGIEIGRKLRNYYILTDEQIKNSNFITRFLVWIREREVSWIQNDCSPFSRLSATCSLVLASINFRCYTTKKFLAQFGGSIVSGKHIAAYTFSERSGIVVAKAEAMRAQLEKENAKPSLSIITRVFSYVRNLCFRPLSTEKLK